MAKRAASDEKPYSPIDQALVNAAVGPVEEAAAPPPNAGAAIADSPVSRSMAEMPSSPRQVFEPAIFEPKEAAGGAVAPPEPQPQPYAAASIQADGRSRVSTSDPNERFQDRRIPLSPQEDAELERLVTAFAAELGAKVKGTHIGRGLLGIFVDAYDHMLARARRAPRVKRPGNGDPIGLMKFEQHVRDTIEAGLRDYLTRGHRPR